MLVNRQPDQILCSRDSTGNAEFDLALLRNLEGHGGEASFRPERLRFTFDYRSQQLDVQNCSDRFGNAAYGGEATGSWSKERPELGS